MKAAVCTQYGKTEDVVEIRDMEKPQVRPNDVMIEVHSASVNPIDYKIQKGDMKQVMKFNFPFIMGFDVSGVVTEVGSSASQFKVGDEVFSRVDSKRFGTFAEFVAVDEKFVAPKPKNVTHSEAAAVPLVGLTSWQCMFDTANLKSGQKVLIHAGSGGIGTIAIQLAKNIGAEVATTTSTKNVELVKSLGADVIVDYKKEDFATVLKDYDVVFETLGGDNQVKSFSVLKDGGYLTSVVGIPTASWAKKQGLPFFMPWVFNFLNRKNNALAKQKNAGFEVVIMEPNGEQLRKMGQMMTEEKLKPILDKEFPLDQLKDAYLYSQSGRARGKITIKVK